MPMAVARQEIAVDVRNSGGNATVSSAEAAPIVAPTFDEVEYQTTVTEVFEIVSEE